MSAYFVQDCPRCGANKITFDVLARVLVENDGSNWQIRFEVPALCRNCKSVVIWNMKLDVYNSLVAVQRDDFWRTSNNVNDHFRVLGYISLKDAHGIDCPEHVPPYIARIFDEAATCKAVNAPNASAAMSRLCLDVITKSLLPAEDDQVSPLPNRNQRKNLFERLDWLFANNRLPSDLKELADAIREHGNGGAHDGDREGIDADDLLDFTIAMLERLYTQPERVRLAKERSANRRAGAN